MRATGKCPEPSMLRRFAAQNPLPTYLAFRAIHRRHRAGFPSCSAMRTRSGNDRAHIFSITWRLCTFTVISQQIMNHAAN